MSQKSVTTKTYNIDQASILITWLIVLHCMAILAAMINSLSLEYKVALIFIILLSLWRYLKYGNTFHQFSLRHNASSSWEIAIQNEPFKTFQILPTTVLTPLIIFLHIRSANKKLAFPILKQGLIKDDFRKLIVDLKISGIEHNDI